MYSQSSVLVLATKIQEILYHLTRFSMIDYLIPANPQKTPLKSESEISYFLIKLFYLLLA